MKYLEFVDKNGKRELIPELEIERIQVVKEKNKRVVITIETKMGYRTTKMEEQYFDEFRAFLGQTFTLKETNEDY